jgi:radical SAM superfamily enzyme YgiQ (UPF0313 family)
MLRRADIPLLAAERERGDPLIILGGPAVSANPEPLAPFADAVVIGEAEELVADLVEVLRRTNGRSRLATLEELARLPGVYVPLLHRGQAIARRWVAQLDDYPLSSTIVAPKSEFGDMHLIELSRGCGHGCCFCLAGYWYRPLRERSLEVILEQARQGLRHTNKIGLVAAAVSDYSRLEELVQALRGMGAKLSASSLRVEPLSLPLLHALAAGSSRSITFAPEAGSERLRRIINKGVSHEGILTAAREAAKLHFETLKLYFMLGLPDEVAGDIEELMALVEEVKGVFPRKVVVNITPFVPKAHTPFQRQAMAPKEVLKVRLSHIKQRLRRAQIQVRGESVEAARIQGMLARGDRRVSEVLLALRHLPKLEWAYVLREAKLGVEEYLRERRPDEALPWDFITSGISPAYLRQEEQRGAAAQETALCQPATCARCGVCAAPPNERAPQEGP